MVDATRPSYMDLQKEALELSKRFRFKFREEAVASFKVVSRLLCSILESIMDANDMVLGALGGPVHYPTVVGETPPKKAGVLTRAGR
jgi:hypothetical protein